MRIKVQPRALHFFSHKWNIPIVVRQSIIPVRSVPVRFSQYLVFLVLILPLDIIYSGDGQICIFYISVEIVDLADKIGRPIRTGCQLIHIELHNRNASIRGSPLVVQIGIDSPALFARQVLSHRNQQCFKTRFVDIYIFRGKKGERLGFQKILIRTRCVKREYGQKKDPGDYNVFHFLFFLRILKKSNSFLWYRSAALAHLSRTPDPIPATW